MTLSILAAALIASGAQAVDYIQSWEYDGFQNDTSMVGRDGWVTGYAPDRWWGWSGSTGAWVYPTTDDSSNGSWGDGGAHDNWFVNESQSFGDARMTSSFFSRDDDAAGLVINHADGSYYLFFMVGYRRNHGSSSGSMGSHPFGNDEAFFAGIAKIEGGSATVLAEVEESYVYETYHSIRFEHDDGRLVAQLWAEWDTDGSPYLEVEAIDPDPLPEGSVGFWGWNTGSADGSAAWFSAIDIDLVDEDEDGIADDDDNCEELANSDQGDIDGDGIGDACDDDPDDPDDTSADDPDDTSADDPGIDPSDTGRPAVGGGIVCGCNGGAAGAGLLPVLLGLFGLARRRR